MSYNIKGEDLDKVFEWIVGYNSKIGTQSEMLADAIDGIVNLGSFKGKSADSIKSYLVEVHLVILTMINAATGELLARYSEYMQPYFSSIDSHKSLKFNETTITETESTFASSRIDLANKSKHLYDCLVPVSDLVSSWTPPTTDVDDALFDAASTAKDLHANIVQHEAHHASQVEALDDIITPLVSFISSYRASIVKPGGYTKGSSLQSDSFQLLANAYTASTQYTSSMQDYVISAYEGLEGRAYERWEEEEAKRLEEEGAWQMFAAGVTLLAGAVVCVVTLGSATPVVAGLTVVAFGTTAVFQGAEMYEGAEKIRLGKDGDIYSEAFNPLRDTIFGGDQAIYDVANMLSTASVGIVSPVGMAAAGAKTAGLNSLKAGGKALLKEVAREGTEEVLVGGGLEIVGKGIFGDTNTAQYFSNAFGGALGFAGGGKGKAKVTSDIPKIGKSGDLPNSMTKGMRPARTKAEVLADNKIKGKAFQDAQFAKLKEKYPNAQSEITIKLDDGTKIRVDAIYTDNAGKVHIVEYKSSKTAPLTANQKAAFNEIDNMLKQGGVVVGKKGTSLFGSLRIEEGASVVIVRPIDAT